MATDLENFRSGWTTYYTLPRLRYSTGMKVLCLFDTTAVVILWMLSANYEHFEETITKYTFVGSVFDVVVMVSLKTAAIFVLLHFLEDLTMKQLESQFQYNGHQRRRRLAYLHILFISTFSFYFFFLIIKCSIILRYVLIRKNGLNNCGLICLVCAFVFCTVETLLSFWSNRCMQGLRKIRVLHILNEDGVEVDIHGKALRRASFKRFVVLLKEEWRLTLLGAVMVIPMDVTSTYVPKYTGRVVDESLKSIDGLNSVVLTIAGLRIGYLVFHVIKSWAFRLSAQKLGARWRKEAFRRLMKQDLSFFYKNYSGEFASRLSGDIARVMFPIGAGTHVHMFAVVIFGGLCVWNMFTINFEFSGLYMAFLPLHIIVCAAYGTWSKRLWHKFQARLAEAIATAEVRLNSVRAVKSIGHERASIEEYGHDIHRCYLVGRNVAVLKVICDGMITGLRFLSYVVLIRYGGQLLYDRTMTAGDLTALTIYINEVNDLVTREFEHIGDIMTAYGASMRVIEILDMDVVDEGIKHNTVEFKDISFDDVSFNYSTRPSVPALRHVTFTLHQGEVTALVGPSGGGKSTLALLMQRMCEPESGAILVDGQDIRNIDVDYLRRNISVVDQESMLFGCSIRENIAPLDSDNIEKVEKAARCVHAHDFITKFAQGYETSVGERGILLSGGERQRIAIARALVVKPKVLVLDEATSYLDPIMEDRVLQNVCRTLAENGGTLVLISQRMSVIRWASRVLYVEEGHLREIPKERTNELKESLTRLTDEWKIFSGTEICLEDT